jgi:hypothetical protein
VREKAGFQGLCGAGSNPRRIAGLPGWVEGIELGNSRSEIVISVEGKRFETGQLKAACFQQNTVPYQF